VEESELLSSKPLIHLESIEDYIGKCNPQNIKSCDYGYWHRNGYDGKHFKSRFLFD